MEYSLIAKKWFIHTALSYIGTPYIWGGDDPSGFDCSGLVMECLKVAGLAGEVEDLTAHELLKRFESGRVDKPVEGALLFYLNEQEKAVHVTICLDEYFQIGASGGGKNVTDSRSAWTENAFVKIRPIRFNSDKMKVVRLFW